MNSNQTETTKGNILIVDDTPDNLRLLSAILTQQGYEVGKAPNGQMALRAAKTALPDLILLDINMPDIDGYEVCKRLKTDDQTKDIPVIFISALDEVWDKVKAFHAGGVGYVIKPFQREEVLVRVENQLAICASQQRFAIARLRSSFQKQNVHLLPETPELLVKDGQGEIFESTSLVSLEQVTRGNILIVDDTPDNLRLLSTILTERGYEVGKARNGQMALKAAKAALPDLILLDINMPNMNGYEVCEYLKADDQTKEIPVIFISALDEVLDKVKAFKVGGVDYITKPFQSEEVLARVENHLKIRALSKALQKEQEKSENLLLNILPQAIVEELKQNQRATPTQYEEATFLFADIVGFAPQSYSMTPTDVVNLLNQVFSIFDQLAQQHGVEKIRTIGDAYFVAGGLPVVRNDHAEAIAEMALDMQKAIARFQWPNGEPLKLRIGINTGGPVVAAVIGIKKFAYDIWGNAVNMACRMETQGVAGRIQVTADTYERLQDKYEFEERGVIGVKGRGEMTTYWLCDRKHPSSIS
jgi:PleD family two-component response regulator